MTKVKRRKTTEPTNGAIPCPNCAYPTMQRQFTVFCPECGLERKTPPPLEPLGRFRLPRYAVVLYFIIAAISCLFGEAIYLGFGDSTLLEQVVAMVIIVANIIAWFCSPLWVIPLVQESHRRWKHKNCRSQRLLARNPDIVLFFRWLIFTVAMAVAIYLLGVASLSLSQQLHGQLFY